jgi:hypothetical protein
VLHCSCSNGCAIDSGADGGDPQTEVLGSIRGAEAAGESPMSKPMSLGVVQSRCASRGAVLVCICANIFQTVFARCSLQLQALLKASNPWQPALKWVMERPCLACGGHHTAPRAIHARRSTKKHEEVCGRVCAQAAQEASKFCFQPKARVPLPSLYSSLGKPHTLHQRDDALTDWDS